MNIYKIKIDNIEIELEKLPNGKFKKPDLANKYNGYKYSICPLKQTVEEIMVFQKPYKTKSCLHDTLAYENGDESITCGALDIEKNRVEGAINPKDYGRGGGFVFRGDAKDAPKPNESGRYPSQCFVNSGTAEVLDGQSGVSKSGKAVKHNSGGKNFGSDTDKPLADDIGYQDTGGCSKILHKCDFEKEEHDLYFYCPKVSKSERNAGCEDLEEKSSASADFRPNHTEKAEQGESGNPYGRWKPLKNNHPTVKPIKLITQILKLFKTPNKQILLDSFAGSFTTALVCENLGIDWIGVEINEEYCKIGKKRIEANRKNLQHLDNSDSI